ncbi:MAG: LysM domain-containing protein [Clostridia bacterium]|nr:LysM domain-containing protein [Clostridia bacterium]
MSMVYDEFYAAQFPTCPGGTLYVVRAGDTLYTIAQRFGTTVNALMAANPGIDPLNLMIGQTICIPIPGPAPCPGFIYVVQPGDTYYLIARRYGTTVDALIRANPGVDPNRLYVGQRICVPTVVIPPPPITRVCVLALSPRVPTYAPNAGGALWLRTDQFGNTQVLVSSVNLPQLSTSEPYRAVFSWPGGAVSVPLAPVAGLPGVWVGAATQAFPATLFTAGAVDVFPGPVLGAFMRDCR